MKLHKKIIYTGTLECLTGLHIGDNKESTDIGGVDSPVVRRKDNGQPYIPGSSLKGKMRCLLEQLAGENADGKCKNTGSDICNLFGGMKNGNTPQQPSRIIVRDSYMRKESVDFFQNAPATDMPYTEVKFENSIDRIRGTAQHPRQIERVPAGAVFEVQFVLNIFAEKEASEEKVVETQKSLEDTLKKGVTALNADYLGGSGTRGYGHVALEIDWTGKPVNL